MCRRPPFRTPLRGLVVLTSLLGLLLAPLLGALGPLPAATAASQPRLDVVLSSISPAVLPAHGRITLTGTVTNPSDEVWHRINVQTFTSAEPITDSDVLAEQARTDPDTDVGDRLTAPHTFAQVGDLAPGESVAFSIKVPRRLLEISGAPGVYWIGVHALGRVNGVRDQLADGRARTFIPLLPGSARKARAKVCLVVPVRTTVRHAPDGSIAHPRTLARSMADTGRLGRIAALAGNAGDRPFTWLVDPAVLDAAATLAGGNPDLGVGPAPQPGEQPKESPTPTDAAAPAAGLDDQGRTDARDWLDTMTDQLAVRPTLALPYGDPDVSLLARHDPELLHRARTRGDAVLSRADLTTEDAVAPPDGYLSPRAAADLSADGTALLSDHGEQRPSVTSLPTGQRVVYADAGTSSGGPRPRPRFAALTLRQRILSEAALRSLAGDRHRLVVQLPPHWDPGDDWQQADFFGGLQRRWLRLLPLPVATTVSDHRLDYPRHARRQQVPTRNLTAADRLVDTAELLGGLLDTGEPGAPSDESSPPSDDESSPSGTASPDTGSDDGGSESADVDTQVQQRLTAAALEAVSYSARAHPGKARVSTGKLDAAVRQLLSSVQLTGTEFVTMSSHSGTLTMSMVNGMDQPIRVGVHAVTDTPGVRVDDLKPMQLAGGQRTTVRLHAHANSVGVHEVSVVPVTASDRQLGTPFTFTLRTSQVGRWFWAILVAVGALLVLLILRRIVVRVRSHRWQR